MAFARFEDLLKESMGLDVASIGPAAIARAVRQRLAACALEDTNVYWDCISASDAELQALIEAVVVSETWFFRDRQAFAALARLAIEEWLPTHPEGMLRLLSVPCSTGEEPYSMAMALLDAGFPASRFLVDAVDISARAVAWAQRGVYGKNSFREQDAAFRARHFDATANGCRISNAVRAQVQFRHGNLLAPGFLQGVDLYDVAFCRNVLIYFDRRTQDQAITVLERALTENGVLFVAPSETGLVLTRDFVSTKIPLAYGFRKARGRDAGAIATHPVQPGSSSAPAPLSVAPSVWRPRAGPAAARTPATPTKPKADPRGTLDEATRLANQGHFIEAAARCERHIREQGPTADALHLLGLVQEARGNQSEAAAFYRKALYLEPNRREVLIHLALLLEVLDNQSEARVLRNRARRLEQAIA